MFTNASKPAVLEGPAGGAAGRIVQPWLGGVEEMVNRLAAAGVAPEAVAANVGGAGAGAGATTGATANVDAGATATGGAAVRLGAAGATMLNRGTPGGSPQIPTPQRSVATEAPWGHVAHRSRLESSSPAGAAADRIATQSPTWANIFLLVIRTSCPPRASRPS
jgi:hypothetical protein